MTRYSWEDVQDEVADLARIAEDIEKRTSLARMAKHAPLMPRQWTLLEKA